MVRARVVSHAESPLPDPVRFFFWLRTAGTKGRGYPQTEARCVAIDALCRAADIPSPTSHGVVRTYREGVRRAKGFARRGQSTAVLRCQLPRPPTLRPEGGDSPPHGSPPRRRAGRPGPSPQTRRRRDDATLHHAALLLDGALRYDDTREGQLGDILFFADVLDVGIFGSKTDPLRRGQTAQLPAPVDGEPSGGTALVNAVHQGLLRLAALPSDVLAAVGNRLTAAHRDGCAGPDQFRRDTQAAFQGAGQVIPRLGYHSFRRGARGRAVPRGYLSRRPHARPSAPLSLILATLRPRLRTGDVSGVRHAHRHP